jgi:hypothetical protein
MANFWAVSALSQNPHGTAMGQTVQSESPMAHLITEAKNADTPEGSQRYARHLAEMFIGDQVGKTYVTAFSRRLVMADLMAMRGKRNWIPESTVAQAFNDLMEQVTDSSSKPFQTNESIVHQIRLVLYNASHHLSSIDSHSSTCLPSEAVLVMIQLLENNGEISPPCPSWKRMPPEGPYVIGCARNVLANALVFRYAISHSHSERVMLYEHAVQVLGF